MKILQNVIRNSLYLGVGQGISGLLYFLATVYLARAFGAEKFGMFSFAESVFLFFSVIAVFGSDIIGAREIAKVDKEHREGIAGLVISIRLIFGLISYIALLSFTLIIKNPLQTKLMIIICGSAIFSFIFLLDWLFWGIEKLYLYNTYVIIRDLLFFIGVILLVHIKASILLLGAIFVLSKFTSSIFLLICYFREYGFPVINWVFLKQKQFFNSCSMMFSTALVGWIVGFFDIMLISIILNEKMTGYYSAAYKPIFFLLLGVMVYIKAVFPILAREKKNSIFNFRKTFIFVLFSIIFLFLPLAVFGCQFSNQLIGVIYGMNYTESIKAFRILVFALLIIAVNTVYSRTLIAAGLDRENFIANISVGTINIVLNLCLVPIIGIIGAAYSKVASDGVVFFYYHKKLSKIIGIPLKQMVFIPGIAISIGILISCGLRLDSVISKIIVQIMCYLIATSGFSYLFKKQGFSLFTVLGFGRGAK